MRRRYILTPWAFPTVLVLAIVAGAVAYGSGIGALGNLAELQPGRTMRASSSDPNWHNGNGDARPIPPGETLVIADLEGPGEIRHIWNTIAAQERGYSRLVVLRMYWDGEDNPSVECPIGDFFGVGHGIDVPFESLPVTVTSEGRARNCYWTMPFRKSAKITVANEGRKPISALYWYVDWQQLPEMNKDTPYFHAMYRQEHPTIMGRNFLIADIEGRGHYVGTVQSVRQRTASWWGEGDDFFFIDGEEEPSLRGTGSEDYFCDAWGFREHDNPFYGVSYMDGYEAGDRTTAYRWHVTDPVSFTKSLRVEIEHKGVGFNEDGNVRSGFEERCDDFATVAYWYQLEPHKPFAPMAPAYDRIYYDYTKIVEAETLLDRASATEGQFDIQALGNASGGGQLFWRPTEAGQELTIPFEVAEAGTYDLMFLVTHSWDYGIYEFLIDDEPLGKALDLLNPSVVIEEHVFPRRTLAAGSHTLRIRNHGKNPESEGYLFRPRRDADREGVIAEDHSGWNREEALFMSSQKGSGPRGSIAVQLLAAAVTVTNVTYAVVLYTPSPHGDSSRRRGLSRAPKSSPPRR